MHTFYTVDREGIYAPIVKYEGIYTCTTFLMRNIFARNCKVEGICLSLIDASSHTILIKRKTNFKPMKKGNDIEEGLLDTKELQISCPRSISLSLSKFFCFYFLFSFVF